MLPNKLSRVGWVGVVGGLGVVAGSSGNKANLAQLELELGLSLAKISYIFQSKNCKGCTDVGRTKLRNVLFIGFYMGIYLK
jgi:hypothetical protein